MNQAHTPKKPVPKLARSKRAVGYFESREEQAEIDDLASTIRLRAA